MDESGRVAAWISIYVRPEHPVQPLFSLRKKGASLVTPLSWES